MQAQGPKLLLHERNLCLTEKVTLAVRSENEDGQEFPEVHDGADSPSTAKNPKMSGCTEKSIQLSRPWKIARLPKRHAHSRTLGITVLSSSNPRCLVRPWPWPDLAPPRPTPHGPRNCFSVQSVRLCTASRHLSR